jgi:triphosphoribosyl-dephospho-CoA synthetase
MSNKPLGNLGSSVGDLDQRWSIGQCATLACLLEVTASKPGNVHRGCDFEDMTFLDFAVSATAIGPVMDAAPDGESVRRSCGQFERLGNGLPSIRTWAACC